jgi:hypothetical protein
MNTAYAILRALTVVITATMAVAAALGQASTQSNGSFDFNADGVIFQTADSASKVIMRFRNQNWATFTMNDDFDVTSSELQARRLRLRFGGTLVDPRLSFNIQLSFTRGDQDWSDTQFPNIVRDAMVFWNFTPDLQLGFGQTKLPGNRQRVISSADLQVPDRSIVNGAFNIDRDFGLQGFWRPVNGSVIVNLRGSVSSGDGRNQPAITGDGLAYTGRVEVLPFGAFKGGGDYFEGDLLRESTPKLSVGVTAHRNANQNRTRGTLGTPLFAQRTASVLYADAILKYQGFSLYTEYASRTAADPITVNPKDSTQKAAILVGQGYLAQLSYCFPSMLEITGRYAVTDADAALAGLRDYVKNENTSLTCTYYANRHRIKGNVELGMNRQTAYNSGNAVTTTYYVRFNTELGI